MRSVSSGVSSVRWVRIGPVFLGVLVLGATVSLKLGVSTSDAAVSPTMHAVVHADDTIGLTFDDGSAVGTTARDVPTIPPGTYVIRVLDDADEHNFHLVGPGVDMATTTGGGGAPTWTVTFQPGSMYRFVCDTHADFMFGVFQTGGAASSGSSSGGSSGGSSSGSSGGSSSGGTSSGGTSSGGTSSGGKATATSSLLGTLTGTIGADGKAKLAFRGKAVKTLRPGRYRITVVDKTPSKSFVVQQGKRSPIAVSGVSFVGKHSLTVALRAGQWSFYARPGKSPKSSFVVVG